ncbi:MAG: GRRM system radical SAM/SPASM domain protein [Crocosphaera sp.]|uniref:Putative arylsulfatase regulatory protein n=4 Tax=Crocosphaera TaxID=263510 RepID=T2JW16_CROWT|nr:MULTISPECIES: cyclophane-forming radical SAM/SPASM peptide maturase GrrM/OscB [Crocosphaera]MCH2245839.1 GRRM system radical SAM/SPASM domain protein [Crocosphaera sp.]CCQ57782.1 putative arylsulfatase regulatory protein [Crocosphaera watsonii WH 0005]CCQ69998.1 putative arylsulfatase regulatory protein [Crocosphaera watsonii WH 0402]
MTISLPINVYKNESIDISSFGPISLVVIQPTPFCNLDCDYCYLPNRNLKKRLSLDLIEPIFKTIFTSPFVGDFLDICWHAGEPLAVPISYYQEMFKRIEIADKKYNHKQVPIYHSIQTNGILINQAWCDFFREHNICVGVSIDGPDFLHDSHRKTRTGLGSHESVMRGIRHLQKNDIYFNIISVITQESLDYADEIFNFFWENGITDVGFNMEETEGVNETSSLDKLGTEQKYYQFMKRFWELTSKTNDEFKVREFEIICGLIYDNQRLAKTDMNHPYAILNIDYLGNFSTFDPELLAVDIKPYGNFILGNVLTDSLESVCDREKFKQIYQDMIKGVNSCRKTCEYFGVCGGGAGSNKYWENGGFNTTETQACRYRTKIVTDVVLEVLEDSFGIN